ncbi:MAG: hypothetical protein E7Z66_01535 [Thermoplasmata archaeon]|nr:hypothetical protein [Thermoplasmata archaeon]
MDSKVIIAAVVALVVIAAGVGAVFMMGGDDDGSDAITYHGNGGKTTDGRTSYQFNDAKVANPLFTNNSFKFIEWNTSANGKGTSYQPGDIAKLGIDLYAIWEVNYSPGEFSCNSHNNLPVYLNGVNVAGSFVLGLKADNVIEFSGYDNLKLDPTLSTVNEKVFTGTDPTERDSDGTFKVIILGAESIDSYVDTDGTAVVEFTLNRDLEKLSIIVG